MLTFKHTSRYCQGSATMQRCGWLWPHGGPGKQHDHRGPMAKSEAQFYIQWRPSISFDKAQGPQLWGIPWYRYNLSSWDRWHTWHRPLRVPRRCEAVTLTNEGLVDQENTHLQSLPVLPHFGHPSCGVGHALWHPVAPTNKALTLCHACIKKKRWTKAISCVTLNIWALTKRSINLKWLLASAWAMASDNLPVEGNILPPTKKVQRKNQENIMHVFSLRHRRQVQFFRTPGTSCSSTRAQVQIPHPLFGTRTVYSRTSWCMSSPMLQL